MLGKAWGRAPSIFSDVRLLASIVRGKGEKWAAKENRKGKYGAKGIGARCRRRDGSEKKGRKKLRKRLRYIFGDVFASDNVEAPGEREEQVAEGREEAKRNTWMKRKNGQHGVHF